MTVLTVIAGAKPGVADQVTSANYCLSKKHRHGAARLNNACGWRKEAFDPDLWVDSDLTLAAGTAAVMGRRKVGVRRQMRQALMYKVYIVDNRVRRPARRRRPQKWRRRQTSALTKAILA